MASLTTGARPRAHGRRGYLAWISGHGYLASCPKKDTAKTYNKSKETVEFGVIKMSLLIIIILVAIVVGSFIEGSDSSSYHDEECPLCGSDDTDGNHCFACDDDF